MTSSASSESRPDWQTAAFWYNLVLEAQRGAVELLDSTSDPTSTDDSNSHGLDTGIGMGVNQDVLVDWPIYRLYGRLADMYSTGGHGLNKHLGKARN
ncbi:unnamed protein product [Protopolystoma xenopodis]|uniref:Uncharacterized protein n=1 Tax=Protopolystoma xenopodis TaxID=117903 RepID=A0A3S5FD22_9PLAT|nr:unnamed protein product [Protopolystoma xenopodis]